MKTLYVECKMGAAGDMLQAALYELLSDKEKAKYCALMNQVFGDAVSVEPIPAVQCGISGTHMKVTVLGTEEMPAEHVHEHHHDDEHDHEHMHEHHHDDEHDHEHMHEHEDGHFHEHHHDEEHMHEHHHDEEHMHEHHHDEEHMHEHHHDDDHMHEHGHEHHHSHVHYSYAGVCHQIEHLSLPENVRKDASEVYRLIGEAEAKVHNSTLENIHFHEVGSLDAMADVVGVSLLISMLKPEQILVSPVHVGNGTVKCAHGILPVPAPATAEILKGIPYYTGSINSELCTPTGAALLKHFANVFCDMPVMTVAASGLGLGTKEFPVANGVRVFLGDAASLLPSEETENKIVAYKENQLPEASVEAPEVYFRNLPAEKEYSLGSGSDEIVSISCNIDDMTGEELGFVMELLLDAGALDVFYEDIHMKKNRPAVMLNCFCLPSQRDRFALLILKYTSTRGVRFQMYHRAKLDSRFEEVETEYGKVRKKISSGYGIEKSKYEYEDLRRIALEQGLSLAEVLQLLS